MSKNYQNVNNLKISEELLSFVNNELLKDLDISSEKFWEAFDKAVHDLAPKNKELIQIRENLQKKIDDWHIKNKGNEIEIEQYKKFLREIGYLKEEGPDFRIETNNVDDEISQIAGPQLVVPIMNARYTLNAANARWVSLYDSLYGTNIIESEEGGSERYDPNRGQEVIKYVREFFDKYIPIDGTSWKNISALKIKDKNLLILKEDKEYKLKDENKFVGHRGDASKPTAIIIKNNNLHFEIIINPKAFSAAHDIAGISDVIAESAVSTICDNEDSVAAVDAEDKVTCYRNWLGLMRGDLKVQFEKNGKKDNKFGVNDKTFFELVRYCKNSKNINLKCLSVHIGSQILDHKPYEKMLRILDKIIKKAQYKFDFIDLGGGMGIPYNNDKKLNYKKYHSAIKKFLKNKKSQIIFEPGRSIIGNTGVLISKVIYIKESYKKNFIILDAAMNDLMRPALYGAVHRILPLLKRGKKSKKIYEFVGPICESTDKFTSIKNFQELKEKDFIAICDVGAYGISLSSNYNLRPKPIEILINGSKIRVVKKRQKHHEII